jgi:hypothetical protein
VAATSAEWQAKAKKAQIQWGRLTPSIRLLFMNTARDAGAAIDDKKRFYSALDKQDDVVKNMFIAAIAQKPPRDRVEPHEVDAAVAASEP